MIPVPSPPPRTMFAEIGFVRCPAVLSCSPKQWRAGQCYSDTQSSSAKVQSIASASLQAHPSSPSWISTLQSLSPLLSLCLTHTHSLSLSLTLSTHSHTFTATHVDLVPLPLLLEPLAQPTNYPTYEPAEAGRKLIYVRPLVIGGKPRPSLRPCSKAPVLPMLGVASCCLTLLDSLGRRPLQDR